MTTQELNRKIGIILSQVSSTLEPIYRFRNPVRTILLHKDDDFIAEPGEAETVNEHLLLLRTLYGQCNPEFKKQFVSLLLSRLTAENAKLICHAAIEVGEVGDLVHVLSRFDVSLGIWDALNEKLATEPHRFSEADLDSLELMQVSNLQFTKAFLNNQSAVKALFNKSGIRAIESLMAVPRQLDRLKVRIDKVRYLRLKKELFEGQNPEVNTDKEVLVSRMVSLNFRQEIVTAINELDSKIYAAGKPLELKGCMDLLRTIYEEVIEDAGRTVATKRSRPVPQGPHVGHFQPWYQILQNEGVITREEAELAQKLYNYLSNAGTHQLGSAPEQARVTRNFVIEFCLMVVGRVQHLK